MVIFIFLVVFIPLEQKTSLNCIKTCGNIYFFVVTVPSENIKILEFDQN